MDTWFIFSSSHQCVTFGACLMVSPQDLSEWLKCAAFPLWEAMQNHTSALLQLLSYSQLPHAHVCTCISRSCLDLGAVFSVHCSCWRVSWSWGGTTVHTSYVFRIYGIFRHAAQWLFCLRNMPAASPELSWYTHSYWYSWGFHGQTHLLWLNPGAVWSILANQDLQCSIFTILFHINW